MHDIHEDSLAYNAKHRIDVGIKTSKLNQIELLLEVEVIGSVTRSRRDHIWLQEDREQRAFG